MTQMFKLAMAVMVFKVVEVEETQMMVVKVGIPEEELLVILTKQ